MSERLATIKIKGKDYTMVKDRIIFFNEEYPLGCIRTDIISEPNDKRVVVKATVTPDYRFPERFFADYSQAVIGDGYINETAALENACTSAVGRALGFMGIGVIESVASADEVVKAEVHREVERQKQNPTKSTTVESGANVAPITLNDRLQASVDAQTRAAQERAKLAEQQGIFSLDGDVLTCKIVGITKKETTGAKKTPYVVATFNGRLPNGANFASCFDKEMWPALDAALDKECKLKMKLDGKLPNVIDVLWVSGVGAGQPVPFQATDDDIPF